MTLEEPEEKWLSVMGKSLAFICLHLADLKTESQDKKRDFLETLGLTRRDIAGLLGTTEESLRVAAYKRTGRKGKTRATKGR